MMQITDSTTLPESIEDQSLTSNVLDEITLDTNDEFTNSNIQSEMKVFETIIESDDVQVCV